MSAPTSASASHAVRPRADGVTALLAGTLQLAVRLHIHELAGLGAEQLREVADGCADLVAAHGDDLQFGGPRCAAAFNALAGGLAVLAYCPGGVAFTGLHWCVHSHPCCPRRPARPERDRR